MATGIVKWYNDAKGFGFIIDNEQRQLLILKNNIINDPSVVFEFDQVAYDIEQTPDGPVALNIKTIRKHNMDFYNHEFTTLNGEIRHLSKYLGQVLLIVNTASQCGLTPQYKGLEWLYQQYKDQGFEILAFPSNNFGLQEPGTNQEIKTFCETNFNTTFTVFEKSNVIGQEASDFYKMLAAKTESIPQWNFHKYIVNRTGTVIKSFEHLTVPPNVTITHTIEQFLKEDRVV